MKRNLLLLSLIAITSLTVFNSCGDKEGTTPDDTKTLDKAKLYDKDWYSEGSLITHYFHSDGKYGNTGSWEWLNGGDSMNIIPYSGGNPEIWYFNWSMEDEMSCKNGKNGGDILFKTSPW